MRKSATAPTPGGDAIATMVGVEFKVGIGKSQFEKNEEEFLRIRIDSMQQFSKRMRDEENALQDHTEIDKIALPPMSLRIKDLPEDERPREKIAEKGASYLSDAEILAVFFGSGTPGRSAVDLGREMIQHFGSLRNLSRASVEELMAINGIGPAKATQLAATFEFGRRLAREPYREASITCPEDVYAIMGPEMQSLDQESVRIIMLNHRKRLIHIAEVFRGTSNESFANPAEILRKALSHAATAIILVHNHPSGDPSPSQADHSVTKRMQSACEAVGIEFTDHMIIGSYSESANEPYFSFRESGLM